jgi:hypothetical protein
MIGYVLILLLLINREVSNAMEVQVGSSDWEAVAQGRTVLESVAQPPLESPVSARPTRANHSLVAAIVVLMVLATAALICCCYMWEQQLRLRVEARNNEQISSTSLQDPVDGSNHHTTNSRMVTATPSTVIVLIGDDIPPSVAWGIPQGIPAVASSLPQAALQPTLDGKRASK